MSQQFIVRHRISLLAIAGLAAIGALPGGCGSGLPGAGVFLDLDVTGAIVASQGILRIELVDPVPSNSTVNLSSSNPAVATIADSAVIRGGSSRLDVPFNGVTVGATNFTVTLGSATRSIVTNVVGSPQLTGLGGPNRPMQVGAASTLYADLNFVTPTPVTVNLSSSNPDVVSVPDTLVISSFLSYAGVPITGGSVGTAIITATIPGSTQIVGLTVVTATTIQTIYLNSNIVPVGVPFIASINLSAIVAADTTMSFTSSNTAVIPTPADVIIPAGGSYFPLTLTPIAAGSTTITVQIGGASGSFFVSARAAPSIAALYAPSRVQLGATVNMQIVLDQTAPADQVVSLASSSATVPVPASVTIGAGSISANLAVTPASLGGATITATLGSSAASTAMNVVTTPGVSFIDFPGRIQVGAAGQINLYLDTVPANLVPVTVSNDGPGVVAVPAGANFGNYSTSAQIPVIGLAVGSANIGMNFLGLTRTETIAVTDTPLVSYVNAATPKVGGFGDLTVVLDTLVAGDTTVMLTQTNAAAVDLPAQLVVPGGRTSGSVSIKGKANAATTITATLGASMQTTTVTPTP